MVLGEDKKQIKEKILLAYLYAKPETRFSQVVKKLGVEMGIKLVDEFWGRVIVIPSRASLQRGALPQIVKDDLEGLKIDSDLFKKKVKDLASFYRLTKRAIMKMRKTGKYSR